MNELNALFPNGFTVGYDRGNQSYKTFEEALAFANQWKYKYTACSIYGLGEKTLYGYQLEEVYIIKSGTGRPLGLTEKFKAYKI